MNAIANATLSAIMIGGIGLEARAQFVMVPADRDNTIYNNPFAELSNGQGEHVFAGKTGSGISTRALIRFDLAAAIPAGSTINFASLQMYVSHGQGGPANVEVHRVVADWGEGASFAIGGGGGEGGGGVAQPGDATWNFRFFPNTRWGTPGGDFVATPSASTMITFVGVPAIWTSEQIAADVQAFVDSPASNFGWILIGDESAPGQAKRFDSRTNFVPSQRPVLAIFYTPPMIGCNPACRADVNHDGRIDGDDVNGFASCLFTGTQPGGSCECADIDGNGHVDSGDVDLFVARVLGSSGLPC